VLLSGKSGQAKKTRLTSVGITTDTNKKGGPMAVKVLIKRIVPEDKAKEMIPLFREMRSLATTEPGYISGETLKRLDKSNEFLVISTWNASDDWNQWLKSEKRKEIQARIDALLGGSTDYEIYHYGFKE
jgi:heme-degrading monooxygenase HmoA